LEFEQSAAIVKTDKTKHAAQQGLAEKAASLKAANAAEKKKKGLQPYWLQQETFPAPKQGIRETPFERVGAAHRSQGPPQWREADRLLTVREVAEFLRCSKSSLDKWRLTGDGPRFVCVGSRVRYRASDVVAFIERQTRASTSATEAAV
jgi:predicted DNA-binding transcriptional regulator AlpA